VESGPKYVINGHRSKWQHRRDKGDRWTGADSQEQHRSVSSGSGVKRRNGEAVSRRTLRPDAKCAPRSLGIKGECTGDLRRYYVPKVKQLIRIDRTDKNNLIRKNTFSRLLTFLPSDFFRTRPTF